MKHKDTTKLIHQRNQINIISNIIIYTFLLFQTKFYYFTFPDTQSANTSLQCATTHSLLQYSSSHSVFRIDKLLQPKIIILVIVVDI